MRSGDVALRLSIVFVVAGSIALAAGIYEIDRREKSSSETVAANLKNLDQRVEVRPDQHSASAWTTMKPFAVARMEVR